MERRLLDATEPLLVLLSASPLNSESVRLSDLLLESEVKSVVISAVAFSQGASSSTTGIIRLLPAATDLRAVAEDVFLSMFLGADAGRYFWGSLSYTCKGQYSLGTLFSRTNR